MSATADTVKTKPPLGDWLLPFIYNTGLAGYRTSILPWVFMGGLVATEQQLVRRT